MAWETRKRGGEYYTRSVRVDGRVVRQYVGSGLVAKLEAYKDALKRENRGVLKLQHKLMVESAELADRELRQLDAICNEEMRKAYEAAGYHYHKGEWRKRRSAADSGS